MSFIVMLICGVIGIVIARPPPDRAFALIIESALLIFALGVVSLRSGIQGAEFVEVPRPRMVRSLTSFLNTILCFVLAMVILSPLIPYALEMLNPSMPLLIPEMNIYVAVCISAVIAAIITFVFYKMTLKSAEEFLRKAEL
jgi:phosphatidylglycerophosphate synthase